MKVDSYSYSVISWFQLYSDDFFGYNLISSQEEADTKVLLHLKVLLEDANHNIYS